MAAALMNNGQVVPAEITVGLLRDAMQRSGGKPRVITQSSNRIVTPRVVLLDGFPRNDSSREMFQKVFGYDCEVNPAWAGVVTHVYGSYNVRLYKYVITPGTVGPYQHLRTVPDFLPSPHPPSPSWCCVLTALRLFWRGG